MPTANGILFTLNITSTLIDKNTGNAIWKRPLIPAFYDEARQTVIGYKNIALKEMCCVSLNDNTLQWKAKIPASYGFADIKRMDDSRIIIASNALAAIDLEKGNIISHPMKIGKKVQAKKLDTDEIMMLSVFGLCAVASGTPFVMITKVRWDYTSTLPQNDNLYYNMCSRIVVNDRNIYFADQKGIHAYNLDLEEVWSSSFATGDAGESGIIVSDSNVILINTGIRTKGVTGEKRQSKKLFYTVCNRFNGEVVKEEPLSILIDEAQHITQTLTDTVYVYNQEKQSFSRICAPQNGTAIATENNRIYTIGTDLKVTKVYDNEGDIYFVASSFPAYNVINHDDDTWIVKKDGTPVVHIQKSFCHPTVAGKYLIGHTKRKNQIISIPLEF
ncbi:MAG: hypothetical protein NC252_01390 [Roseburia sp.]|nr:hypothetical protein [Roseburia sp.]MCM1419832.1 hypothetical protein [Bacteroides sp.]